MIKSFLMNGLHLITSKRGNPFIHTVIEAQLQYVYLIL